MTELLSCSVCGIGFRGRSDAMYCSPACRQKAHRGRIARRVAALVEPQRPRVHPTRTVSESDVADTIERARHQQRRARDLCRAAAEVQRRPLASQRSASPPAGPEQAAVPPVGHSTRERS